MSEVIKIFLPWILYFMIASSTYGGLKLAIILAAVSSLLIELKYLKKGFILSWVTLAFFAFMLVVVVLFKNAWVMQHAWVLSNGTLALMAWTSMLVRKPFTIQYAKQQVSSDKWAHPLFFKINYCITFVWAMCFSFGFVTNMLELYAAAAHHWIYELCYNIAIVLAIWFTSWFPKWCRERFQRQENI